MPYVLEKKLENEAKSPHYRSDLSSFFNASLRVLSIWNSNLLFPRDNLPCFSSSKGSIGTITLGSSYTCSGGFSASSLANFSISVFMN